MMIQLAKIISLRDNQNQDQKDAKMVNLNKMNYQISNYDKKRQ